MDLRMIVARVLVMVSIMGTAPSLFSQQGVSDRNINTLRINKPDTSVKSVLPHKLQPASTNTPIDKKDSLIKAQNSISKAIVSLNEGNTAMALFHIYEALNFTPGDAVKTQAIATSYYGVIQVRLGNHTKAVNAMNASDSMFTSLGDEGLLAFHYNNLGLFHQKFGNDQAAGQHFIKSLEISRNLKDYPNIAIKEWLKALEDENMPWPQVLAPNSGNELMQQYQFSGIPFIILIDRDGKIVAKNLRGEALVKAIENQLKK